jgi:hypothetical protein
MKKRITNRKKLNSKSKNRKSKKTLKRKVNRVKGGNNDQVQCSMCENIVPKKDTLVPSICSLQHGQRAHRICQDCWWNPNTGFALETTSHKCPGCSKGLPLLPKEKPIIVDLTD